MKNHKDKNIFAAVTFLLSALIVTAIMVHGCGISSYESKKITSISIDPVNNTPTAGAVAIAAQTVQQFKAMGHYSDATTSDVSSSSTWSTSDPSVATISADGLAAAVASSGTCTITAASVGMTASIQLTVKNLAIQSITVSPATASVNKGFTQQFTATGLFSNGTETIPSQDITTLVSWSSTTTSVATVGLHTGLATGVSAGTTDIAAQWNAVTSNTAAMTVSNLALVSITVTESNKAADNGTTAQLTAMGTFEDATTQDMTTQVAWDTSDPTVATVDSTGLVTPVKAGRVTFTATAGGVTGSLDTTVLHLGH